jgi:hypothetical protein
MWLCFVNYLPIFYYVLQNCCHLCTELSSYLLALVAIYLCYYLLPHLSLILFALVSCEL